MENTSNTSKEENMTYTWRWLGKCDLKVRCVWDAQGQTLRLNCTQFQMDKNSKSNVCRMCGGKSKHCLSLN